MRLGTARAKATGTDMNISRIIIATHHRPATGPEGLVKNPPRHTARSTKHTIRAVLLGVRRLPVGRRDPEAREEGCWASATVSPSPWVVRFEAVIVGSFAKNERGAERRSVPAADSACGLADRLGFGLLTGARVDVGISRAGHDPDVENVQGR